MRVVPGGADWAELLLTGKIAKSNGKNLEVELGERRGGPGLGGAQYKQRADTSAYAKDRPVDGRDPFQALYNRVANDLVRARDKRKPPELAAAREVAACASPPAWPPTPTRPTWPRTRRAASRVRAAAGGRRPGDGPRRGRSGTATSMFVDTLNEYYADFYARMDKPYDDWRAYSYTEQVALDSINRASLLKKISGGSRSWGAS